VPPTSTPAPTASATPPPASDVGLVTFADPTLGFSIAYPVDWARLTDEQILAQLGDVDADVAEATLAGTVLVAVSSDGQAMLTVTTTALSGSDLRTLDDVVRAVREADAAIVSTSISVATEATELGGIEAVRLTYTEVDPATGRPTGRSIRRTVAIVGTDAVVLTFVVAAAEAPAFEGTFRQIEASWRWDRSTR
jgi:hypothetical protein